MINSNTNIPTRPSWSPKSALATAYLCSAKIIKVNTYQYSSETPMFEPMQESQLSQMAMVISEKSLAEDWEDENDEHWASFEAI